MLSTYMVRCFTSMTEHTKCTVQTTTRQCNCPGVDAQVSVGNIASETHISQTSHIQHHLQDAHITTTLHGVEHSSQ